MSQESVEVVRELVDSFQRGDLERPFELMHTDIEWDASRIPGLMGAAGIHRGHEGVRTFWQEWLAAWRDLEFHIEDVRDAGDDVVLLISDQRQWGRLSGIATRFPPYAQVFTVRNGKVVRWRNFPDQHEALKAVGLEE
jgi:ketosteroid isomerase-like protein